MKKICKILLLFLIYFLPFVVLGLSVDLWLGLWWSLILFLFFIFLTYFLSPLFILGTLSATKKEDRRYTEVIQEVHQVAFRLRMNPPKIYFTTNGAPSVWGFGLQEKATYLVIHQDLVDHLNQDERMSLFTYQLLRLKKSKLNLITFIVGLGLWFYFPLKIMFRGNSKILSGAYFLFSSIFVLISEMLHSIIFNEEDIYQIDQETVRSLTSQSSFVSALTKIDSYETQLHCNERFLQIISALKPNTQKDFFNFFINFPSAPHRIDLLQSSQSCR